MVIFNAAKNRKPSSPTTHSADKAQIRYKLHTAATSRDIGSQTGLQFAQFLRKRFQRTYLHPDEPDEFHFSLLARLPRQYATDLHLIYDIDDLKTGDLPLLPEQAQMRIAFDFDGADNPDWHLQLSDALLDVRRFAEEQLLTRRLIHQMDFDVYFTGSKGFRVMVRGLTHPGDPKALCDAMRVFCDELIERYPSLDLGIYNPSPNSGMIRGPGSRHPKTGLCSIFLTSEELLDLPITTAIEQIIKRAQIHSRREFKASFVAVDPFALLGLREEPGEALQGFLDEITQEAISLAWIARFQPKSQSLQQINLEALIEQEGLEVRSFIQEEQTALLKACPSCGKQSKAWITRSGRLRCWRSSCEASHVYGGLSLREWSHCTHPEELLKLKPPEGFEPLFCAHQEIELQLAQQRDRFFLERDTVKETLDAWLQRVSPGCKKSTFALDGMVEAILRGESIAFTTPNHALTNEKLVDFQRMCLEKGVELKIMRWRGRDAVDEEGKPMCSQPQRVESAIKDNLPIQQHACRRCPMFKECSYQRQYIKLAELKADQKELGIGFGLALTHHALWGLSQNEKLLNPDRVVLDEDPVGACLNDKSFSVGMLLKEFAEPAGLEVELDAVFEPARALLRQALHKARLLNQKQYDRELRKARKKGSRWLPRAERRVAQEGLLALLLDLNPEAPLVFARAYEAIQEAQKELLRQSEELLPQWRTMLSPAFQLIPLLEALLTLLPVKEELFDKEDLPSKGFCLELSFHLERPKESGEPNEPEHQKSKGKKKKSQTKKQPLKETASKKETLVGGAFVVQEARSLPYQGPVLGLDATGEELPWQAMLGRPVETLRLDAPLHKDSLVDWFELGTYQSALLRYGEEWMDKYLINHVKHKYEQGKKILILTWLKPGPDGSYKERVIKRLEESGLPVDGIQLDVAHFFAERGKNRWRDWDVAVLWGMPVENPDALRMKCEALSQLVPEEQRKALREQLHYQYSAGEGLQGLHRVGAIVRPKEWLIFASSGFLPLADYLKETAAPGRFRKRDCRTNEALDPTLLDRLEELAQKIASVGFCNPRVIAGLMGFDPSARGALLRMGLLKRGEGPLGVVPQGFDQICIEGENSSSDDIMIHREAIETLGAKGIHRCLGRREQERIERRVAELTNWHKQKGARVILTDIDGNVRPYKVVGDAVLARQFLALCLELDGKSLSLQTNVHLRRDDKSWQVVLESCREAVEAIFAAWQPESPGNMGLEWTEEAYLWAYWTVSQWTLEQGENGSKQAISKASEEFLRQDE